MDGDLLETASVLDDLAKVFADTEDAARLAESAKVLEEVRRGRAARAEEVKMAVAALAKEARESARQAENAAAAEALAQEREEAEKERDARKANVDGMHDAVKAIEAERNELSAKTKRLADRRAAVEAAVQEAVPRVRHELGLYAHISKISWDANTDEGDVTGHASDPKRGDVVPFAFRSGECSDVDLADKLWDLMDTQVAAC